MSVVVVLGTGDRTCTLGSGLIIKRAQKHTSVESLFFPAVVHQIQILKVVDTKVV